MKLIKAIAITCMLVFVGASVAACGDQKPNVTAVGDHAGGNSEQPAQ